MTVAWVNAARNSLAQVESCLAELKEIAEPTEEDLRAIRRLEVVRERYIFHLVAEALGVTL